DRLWVRLPPVLLKPTCVGWALASLTACKAAAFGMCRFNSCPAHLRTRPVLLTAGCEPLKLVDTGSSPVRVTETAKWRNGIRATLRTSCPLGHASSTLALATDIAGVAGAQSGFMSLTSPARYRDLQLMAEYANRQSDHVENVVNLQVRF